MWTTNITTVVFTVEQVVATSDFARAAVRFEAGADRRTIIVAVATAIVVVVITVEEGTIAKKSGSQRLAAIIRATIRHYQWQKSHLLEYRDHLSHWFKLSSVSNFLPKINYR